MKILNFEDAEAIALIEDAIRLNNLIPIIGAGFTKGEKAFLGLVPDSNGFIKLMSESIIKHSAEYHDDLQSDMEFKDYADLFLDESIVPRDSANEILRNHFTQVKLSDQKKNF